MLYRTGATRWAGAALCMLMAVLAWGCAPAWKRPRITLGKIALAGGTIFEQGLKLSLKVTNPNDRDIPLERLRFELLVAGVSYANGQSDVPVNVPRRGEATVEIEASLQLARLLSKLPSLKGEDGRVPYQLKGEAVVQGFGTLPFDQAGSLSPGDLKRFLLR